MELTQQQLQEIEALAGVFFPLKKIAIVLELDAKALSKAYENEGSAVYQAVERGKLTQEAELRKVIFTLAKGGSSPAQSMAMKIIDWEKIEGF